MAASTVAPSWPVKTREMHNHHMDSTVWNNFPFRDTDVIVATYGKAGTTWTQQIVSQLVYNGVDVPIHDVSPWLDLRVMQADSLAKLEVQSQRRIIKTHLPLDALTFSPKAKYLYIARDGRDVMMSMHNHHKHGNELWYKLLNDTPGRVGPPIPLAHPNFQSYFRTWLDNDGQPFWPFFGHISSWWAARHLPDVLMVHFAKLKANPEREIRAIAAFLGCDIAPEAWPVILEHCSFDYMKKHAERYTPAGGVFLEGGASTFINKGTNGRWKDLISAEDSVAYEAKAFAELGPECAHWLATGEMPAAN